jgi:hypothetical protein
LLNSANILFGLPLRSTRFISSPTRGNRRRLEKVLAIVSDEIRESSVGDCPHPLGYQQQCDDRGRHRHHSDQCEKDRHQRHAPALDSSPQNFHATHGYYLPDANEARVR